MGKIKDRNGMDLTETEDVKKRWQEYTEELYKKDLHDPDNHDGVITHLEPDILEIRSQVGLGSSTTSKVSGGVGYCCCSVAQSCPTLCDPMGCSMPRIPVLHQLPEFAQTPVHSVGDAIQPSQPLLSPSSRVVNLSQHQSLFS